MGTIGRAVRTTLYRTLSLEHYLRVLSGLYLWGYRLRISPHAGAYEYPCFLRQVVQQGDTVLDIGANLGYYAYAFSTLVGSQGAVHAVEPVAPIRQVLRHNLRHCANVKIYDCALGDHEAVIRMGNATVERNGYFGTGQNFVVDKPTEGLTLVEFEAQMRCGSRLFEALDRIDFVKCDIEGYERVVMPEMRPLFERHHPTLLIETGGETRRAITALFESMGYKGYTLQHGALTPLTEADTKDIFFIHEMRKAHFAKLLQA
ncbi:MAG: FkbM family methyltransferase [Alistipes sp.]|nr:FkbM family methyltransferase [Alistipes sp.]